MILIRRRRPRRSAVALAAVLLLPGLVLVLAASVGAGDDPAGSIPDVIADVPAEVSGEMPDEVPAVGWLTYREAKAISRHQDRPLLVYFGAAWNNASVRLDREAWTDRHLCRYLNEHLVVARVDMQDMPAVAEHFDVKEPPAILFLAPDGRRLVVLRGFHGPEAILRVATYVGSRAYEYADYEIWLSRNPGR
jgi:thioredoxin-related protein